MYERVQIPRMQPSSVRIVHWKRELLHFPFQKEVSQPRQGKDLVFRVHVHRYFPGICDAAGGKAATPPIPGLCFQRNSMFLYSLLKSAANAVLKLMSAVIAIALVLFVSMQSLYVSIMLLEYSFGKLKYDSTTLAMSGSLGPSPVSASKSPVSLAILNFLINKFLVRVSPTPTPRTKISIDDPVDRIPDVEVGSRNE